MKRLTAALSAFLILALVATPTLAQQDPPDQRARPDSMRGQRMGMMQEGMMGPGMMLMHRMHRQMMQNPMHRSGMMAFTLPALADTLGLSEEQTSQLKTLKSELMSQRQERQEQMKASRKQLMNLFEDDSQPTSAEVRKHLMAMAELRANQQAALYETAQQMRQVLTDAQRQTLDDMSPHERMHQMMAHMTVMDMMQMMQTMRGGVMQGMQTMPMMRGQMMQQGGMRHNMPKRKNKQNQQNQ